MHHHRTTVNADAVIVLEKSHFHSGSFLLPFFVVDWP